MKPFIIGLFILIGVGAPPLQAWGKSDLKWDPPYLVKKLKSGSLLVAISGTLPPKTIIAVSQKKLLFTKGTDSQLLNRKNVMVGKSRTRANSDGEFKLLLKIPQGLLTLPLRYKTPSGRLESFLLQISVEADDVNFLVEEALSKSPSFHRKYSLWSGIGANYLIYKQNILDLGFDAQFDSLTIPTFLLALRSRLSKRSNIWFSVKNSQATNETGSYQLSTTQFNWITMAAEYQRSFHQLSFGLFGSRGPTSVIFGIQYHSLPYLARLSLNAAEIRTAETFWVSTGLTHEENLNDNWVFETFIRGQYIISSPNNYKVNSAIAFDGSIGLVRKISKSLRLGFFQYGHQISTKHMATDALTGRRFNGEQTLFFTNSELRLGWQFE